MRLLGLSDLHVGHEVNREAIASLPGAPDDWLVLGGDLCESAAALEWVLDTLSPRFAKLIWVPGNHELWTTRSDRAAGRRGVTKYNHLVDLCRARGVLTPEDPYVRWPGPGPERWICPLFLLYDYSFSPDGMSVDEAKAWAKEDGIVCADERLLEPHPFPSREAWCAHRLALSARRLTLEVPPGARTVLINHWPLRRDLCRLFRIPRFTPWCGSRITEDWHVRFRAEVVLSGHLHMRSTDWRDGVRFEEISLGYPRHWQQEKGAPEYVRTVLGEGSPPDRAGDAGPFWHR
ncbi:MAG: putative phosphodiesterase [Myxococcota bacterium]|jgi:predicted phosphodiesterase